jgi:hypothetical protein
MAAIALAAIATEPKGPSSPAFSARPDDVGRYGRCIEDRMLRLGLCCGVVAQEAIRFRTTTVRHASGLPEEERRDVGPDFALATSGSLTHADFDRPQSLTLA